MFKMRLSFCGPVAHDAEGHDGEEVEKQTEYRPEGFVHALVHGALIEPCDDGQPVVKRQHGPQHAEAADDGVVHRIERGYLAFPCVLTVMLTISVVPVAALAAVRIIRIIRAVRGGLLRRGVLLLDAAASLIWRERLSGMATAVTTARMMNSSAMRLKVFV